MPDATTTTNPWCLACTGDPQAIAIENNPNNPDRREFIWGRLSSLAASLLMGE